jgi:two-component system, NarL family, response regulator DesR
MIRVVIAEDQLMVRGALSALLAMEPDIEVVAQISRGDEIVPTMERVLPDVALLDIELPGGDGLTAAAELHRRLPKVRVIILTTFGRPGYLRRAMEAGVIGYVLKEAPADTLAATIRRAMEGKRTVDPTLAVTALSEGGNPLTEREREVLAMSREVATIADIAGRLFLSEGTVRNHLSTAIQKLDAHNRGEAARIAEQKGWLDPAEGATS